MGKDCKAIIISEVMIILLSVGLKNENVIYIGSFIIIIMYIIKKMIIEAPMSVKLNIARQELISEVLNVITWKWDVEKNKLHLISKDDEDIGKVMKLDKFIEFIVEEDRERVEKFIAEIKKKMILGNKSISFKIKCEENIKTLKVLFNIKNKDSIIGVALDLTKKIEQEKRIKDSEKIYRLAVQGSRDVLFYWDTGINIITLKGKITEMLESCEESSLKLSFGEFLNYIHEEDKKQIEKIHEQCIKNEKDYFDIEFRFKDNDVVTWCSLKGKTHIEDDETYIYGSLSNINDRKEKEEEINFISYYDEITGLPNRRMFKESVEKTLEDLRENYRNMALVFIDLDNFKYINDTYGHEIGDKLLKAISLEIRNIASEDCLLARFGGDEFIFVVDNLKSFDHLEEVLNEIIETCSIGFTVEGVEIHCTVSIGVAIFGKDGTDFDNLMKRADLAMYTAKDRGKNKYEFFNDGILKKINREVDIKENLVKALTDNELYGVLQPKIEAKTGDIIGFEYLVRWESEKLGIVSPAEFIRISENTGQIIEIGKFIIRDAVDMCKKLTTLMKRDFKVAINLSEVQLRDPSIVEFIKITIEENEVDPKNIEIEITESIIMECAEKNISVLRMLKDVGVTIALDDFGTGYSSLSYLTVLPIDILKIDKSFIDYINKDKKSEYIIKTIIELSHCFKFSVVAEGVETEEQFEYLKENDCDIIQGYYFSEPLPFNEIEEKIGI